jgi:glutathione synthase/RimK-type ligase-like ATP-grasp enzyme
VDKIYAHDDKKFWGRQLQMAAGRAGVDCVLFSKPEQVPNDARAFVRLDQQAEQRSITKGLVGKLFRAGVTTLPTNSEADLYDDKIGQYKILSHHMPHTEIITDLAKAKAFAQEADYPFISKATSGASSKNVRLVSSQAEAVSEAQKAFGRGIPISYERRQTGYVFWQKFVDGNDCDYRVCVAGGEYFGLVRRNRSDAPFASGSGDNYPLTLKDDREREALRKAVEITAELGTQLMAYDFVFDGDRIYLLEVSSSWTPHAYALSPCFTGDGKPTGGSGGHLFDLIVRAMTC